MGHDIQPFCLSNTVQQPLSPADCFDAYSLHILVQNSHKELAKPCNILETCNKRAKDTTAIWHKKKKKQSLALPMPLPHRSTKNLLLGTSGAPKQLTILYTIKQHKLQLSHCLGQSWQTEQGRKKNFPSWSPDIVQQVKTPVRPTNKPFSTNRQFWSFRKITITFLPVAEGREPPFWLDTGVRTHTTVPLFHYCCVIWWTRRHIRVEVRISLLFTSLLPSTPHLLRILSLLASPYCFAVSTTCRYFIKSLYILRPLFCCLNLLISIPLHYYCILTNELLARSILNSSVWKTALDKANCIAIKVSFHSSI